MPDNSCYAAVLTRMPGIAGEMIDWWFSWHALESLRYKIWYPGSHAGISVRDSYRLTDTSIPESERFWNNPQYPVEDIGIGPDILSITFTSPREFGFDVSRFKAACVATVICAHVGSVTKKVEHTRMCHFVRETGEGVEMRSRFWIGGAITLNMLSKNSVMNRIINTRYVRKMLIPKDTPRQMVLHYAQEYNNLARILPDLFNIYGMRQNR